MANGNFGGGTGTIEDPYLIEDIADFRAMNDSTAYFKMVNDIDINNTIYADSWTYTTLKFLHLDGNGRKFRNLIVTTNYGFYISCANTIENMIFENISLSNSGLFYSSSASNFKYNKLSVILSGTNPYILKNYTCFANTISVSGIYTAQGYGLLSAENKTHQYNSFYLDDVVLKNSSTAYLIAFNAGLQECYIRGKLTTSNTISVSLCNDFRNSYFAIKTSNLSALTCNPNSAGKSFYNADLINEGCTVTVSDYLYALTTSQCKSAEYLNSIGFLCTDGVV